MVVQQTFLAKHITPGLQALAGLAGGCTSTIQITPAAPYMVLLTEIPGIIPMPSNPADLAYQGLKREKAIIGFYDSVNAEPARPNQHVLSVSGNYPSVNGTFKTLVIMVTTIKMNHTTR